MSPSDPHSSLAALRQLKEMLDAGTITPQEFETLKRQIVFGAEPALPLTSPADDALAPTPAVVPEEAPEALAPEPETTLAAYDTVAPNPAELPPPPPASPDWLAAVAPTLFPADESDLPPIEERRNPLNLVFAIGGLLVFLGVVAYLLIGRPTQPDEHLTSGTQTAADSTAVVPEVGPQAEQLNLPPAAAPETVRVAPAVIPAPAAGQFRSDSAVAAPAASPAPATKAPVAAPASPATTTMTTDSAATTKPPQ
ncbi:SHOCT domain-containing protein [Hymenobacter cheonanensis]|uniref:SHOCT domain-containing protein n=1 Tax=Hymenobacter sp. CA2-7 TaxID=3063993 RepID=UPI002713B54D|nr:SHOCT domain-containing protein [Hymenobacter sp. CA2-7]MDO7885139.1 SHOCT domain-containing protein [Hymenobacter sp. CA2-7]